LGGKVKRTTIPTPADSKEEKWFRKVLLGTIVELKVAVVQRLREYFGRGGGGS